MEEFGKDLVAGLQVGPSLRLVRELGSGGMGRIWIADHLSLKTQVAVKFLTTLAATAPNAVARFSAEAAAAARIRSPHVVQVLDHGFADGVPFIVMELLEGEDLATRLRREGRLSPADTVGIVRQTCKALAKAHEVGIIHRDVKPANIFLTSSMGETFVKVLDFGLAKQSDPVGAMTASYAMMGTPHYISPEQAQNARDVTPRSDLWSLAVVVYECLVGGRPFEAESVMGICIALMESKFAPPTTLRPGLPIAIDAWFARAFQFKPRNRFESASELAATLAVALGEAPAPTISRSGLPEMGDVVASKYVIERVIGRGAMGVVFAARHAALDERVAIKFLTSEKPTPEDVERFVHEGRAASRIRGEHVARVLDVGAVPGGNPYLVMEYLTGSDLGAQVLSRGALPVEETVSYVLQACEALAEAHVRGVVHRDLKPSNLFLAERPDGSLSIKVLDFGVAKLAEESSTSRESRPALGSPAYMAPEQIRAKADVSARADIWSLGVVMFELLTGSLPFTGTRFEEVADQVLHAAAPRVRDRRGETPALLDVAIARCLERNPEDRFPDVGALAAAIAPFGPANARESLETIARTRARLSKPDPAEVGVATMREQPTPPVVQTHTSWGVRATGSRKAPRLRGRWAIGLAAVILAAALAVGVRARRAPEPGLQASTGSAPPPPPSPAPSALVVAPGAAQSSQAIAPAATAPAASASSIATSTPRPPARPPIRPEHPRQPVTDSTAAAASSSRSAAPPPGDDVQPPLHL